ncbi:hypothetical protein [Arthrobacter rhizosphaerae]|uniref:hypothetical protein n=1 Tax=Arthrobacter rhizosphaerae TaxID=2855490 RepID=UPI001FF48AB8|nr:hypothetical protein [Arthrobacter rhizosphaerae]
MFDISLPVPDGARSLAGIGQVLGAAGVGLEGGGMWSGTSHYLVGNAAAAVSALDSAGYGPVMVQPVVIAELEADVPGALGLLMMRLAEAGVQLKAQYSDHDNRKILVVDDPKKARAVLGETADQ